MEPRLRDDPLARAARTRQIGRRLVAIAILTLLGLSPPSFLIVDCVAPGWVSVWIMLVWLAAIALVAVSVEVGRDPGESGQDLAEADP